MKLVAGSILTVTSSVFYLARIQAQAINFDSAFKLASRCSLGLFLAGVALVVWGVLDEIMRNRPSGNAK